MTTAVSIAAAVALCGCAADVTHATDPGPATLDARTPDGVDAAVGDARALPDAALAGATYRTSLTVCWTDPACRRALVVSHGGDWTSAAPYGSRAAFVRAFDHGADGIKTDLLVTKDKVAVVAHTSPIAFYESLDCAGRKIEEMTAAEVTSCHLFPSTTETYQRVDDVLGWARGKVIVMLTVKDPSAFADAIALIAAAGAADFVFFEVGSADVQTTLPAVSGWDQLHYLVSIGSQADADLVLGSGKSPPIFMGELSPGFPDGDDASAAAPLAAQIHAAGLRPFAASDKTFPTVASHQARFDEGYDVVMSYDLANGVAARTAANLARGVSPP